MDVVYITLIVVAGLLFFIGVIIGIIQNSYVKSLENTVSISIISDGIRNSSFSRNSRNDNIESLDVNDDCDEELI